ncbi:hypothetical protein KIN20_006185 [Parelaphostrongylus tenuis]|uniref:Uncharacterized protein n=1 Tax=Parelaphostrongylus tenuis TaxID=148309 RepID=A0AAD5M5N8_PARTN|nr:hypothetical protein KIN20_006185 [Parelaphostrongylus tenuis]
MDMEQNPSEWYTVHCEQNTRSGISSRSKTFNIQGKEIEVKVGINSWMNLDQIENLNGLRQWQKENTEMGESHSTSACNSGVEGAEYEVLKFIPIRLPKTQVILDHLRFTQPNNSHVMESSDVTSLYTNVSNDSAMQAIFELLNENEEKKSSVKATNFLAMHQGGCLHLVNTDEWHSQLFQDSKGDIYIKSKWSCRENRKVGASGKKCEILATRRYSRYGQFSHRDNNGENRNTDEKEHLTTI